MDTPDQNPIYNPPKARLSKKKSSQPQVILSLSEKLFILAIDNSYIDHWGYGSADS